MTFDEWHQKGISEGWVGPAVCYTHEGLPTSEIEDQEFEEYELCIHLIRLYPDLETKKSVEKNHLPSIWLR